jgi:hypothetical protein
MTAKARELVLLQVLGATRQVAVASHLITASRDSFIRRARSAKKAEHAELQLRRANVHSSLGELPPHGLEGDGPRANAPRRPRRNVR